MTPMQKQQIQKLRAEGLGYGRISQALGLAKSTVKSYCTRNEIPVGTLQDKGKIGLGPFCPQCGNPIVQKAGKKPRRFCTDACRVQWWTEHPEKLRHHRHAIGNAGPGRIGRSGAEQHLAAEGRILSAGR